MNNPQQLITDNLNIWTAAIKKRGSQGRGSSKKIELHGIKKLRELILELAVRGLLVPQNPNDEPASVLLEKIAAEKAQLIKDGKIKTQKPLPEISDDEKPFELPKSWEWQRVNDVFYSISVSKNKIKTSDILAEGKVPVVDQGQSFVAGYTDRIELEIQLPGPVIIFGDHTSALKFIDFNFVAGADGVKILRPVCVNEEYFHLVAKTLPIENRGYGRHYSRLVDNLFPLPPEAEQPRIVAKVDELMALCDQLEQQTEDSLTVHQTLVETLLNSLLDAAQTYPGHASDVSRDIAGDLKDAESSHKNKTNSDPFQQTWQRIWENFDVLFVTEHSIDQLKQTILQLAVMGKLVPQNENDEPASVLLEKIAAEKEQLIKDKKIKKQKPLPEITDEEKPFELPKGWGMVRFEDVADIQSGITKGRKLKDRETTVIPYLSVANVQRSYLVLEPIKEVEIPIEEVDKYRVLNGDLLITEGGDWDKVGRTAVWRDELAYVGHQNHVFKARKFLEEQSELWLEKYLNCPFSRDYFAGSSKQTTNLASINKTQLRGCLIAVPPAEEKNRIVAKVDELMALCDTLKERIRESQATQLHLADAMAEQAL
ncbi:restriction endonuclease subunit S [Bermanella sp. WJH001]|uniref:restriction endonuclease subunit S n=1 Tax=Bermanella sp. WJH001 TaxID=3048005 RepID=UPI0024BD76D6|nr:restriction endonuclease subunit S [Bermanella sp. WJH001]MDJ1537441.1 restriction endonuclease subunit S [Bermanella sp. WJH001]